MPSKKKPAKIIRKRSRPLVLRDERPKCFVYVLAAIDARGPVTYVGWTTDLEARLAQHNSGRGAKSTRGRRWRLIYAEALPDKRKAMSREWHLKRDRAFRKTLRERVSRTARA